MKYVVEDGSVFTRLSKVANPNHAKYLSKAGYKIGDLIHYKPISDYEYKKALKLDKEDPSDPRSLSSIIKRLQEGRKEP